MELSQAIQMHDEAYIATLLQEYERGNLTDERIREISEESNMWLDHIMWLHGALRIGQSPSEPDSTMQSEDCMSEI